MKKKSILLLATLLIVGLCSFQALAIETPLWQYATNPIIPWAIQAGWGTTGTIGGGTGEKEGLTRSIGFLGYTPIDTNVGPQGQGSQGSTSPPPGVFSVPTVVGRVDQGGQWGNQGDYQGYQGDYQGYQGDYQGGWDHRGQWNHRGGWDHRGQWDRRGQWCQRGLWNQGERFGYGGQWGQGGQLGHGGQFRSQRGQWAQGERYGGQWDHRGQWGQRGLWNQGERFGYGGQWGRGGQLSYGGQSRAGMGMARPIVVVKR